MANSEFNNSNQWVLSVYLLCLVPHSSLSPCSFAHCPHGNLFFGLCLPSIPFLSSVLQSVYQFLYSILSVKRSGTISVFQQTQLTHTQLLPFNSVHLSFKIFTHLMQNSGIFQSLSNLPCLDLSSSQCLIQNLGYHPWFLSPAYSHPPLVRKGNDSTLNLSPSPGIHACANSPLVFSLGPPQLISHPEPKVIWLKYK